MDYQEPKIYLRNNSKFIGFGSKSLFVLIICIAVIPSLHAEPISPLNSPEFLSEAKSALGEKLFHDTRLSIDDSISCASCHILNKGGTDNLVHSVGVNGAQGNVNAPTVFNIEDHLSFFWDGRAATLQEQAAGPIHNPVEMGSDWSQVIDKLSADDKLKKEFKAIYPDGITADNIADAIVEFERSLVTLNAPFDRWLNGEETALTEEQLEGYRLFQSYGCIACHQGKLVGGNMYATMGEMGDYFSFRGGPLTQADMGRFNVTGINSDRHAFKVPSLRLVRLTAPYFHDGSVKSLSEAIRVMGRFQLGREIPDEDVTYIEVFLTSLTGTHPKLMVEE